MLPFNPGMLVGCLTRVPNVLASQGEEDRELDSEAEEGSSTAEEATPLTDEVWGHIGLE